jgi:hypothetical protein
MVATFEGVPFFYFSAKSSRSFSLCYGGLKHKVNTKLRKASLFRILLSTTNRMQHYAIFFITLDALYVSSGFSAHLQELKNCTNSIWYVPGLLLLPLGWLGSTSPTTLAVAAASLARTR